MFKDGRILTEVIDANVKLQDIDNLLRQLVRVANQQLVVQQQILAAVNRLVPANSGVAVAQKIVFGAVKS